MCTANKTLIYHSGALGDFVSILPALKYYKHTFNAELTLLGKRAFGTFAEKLNLVDKTIDLESYELSFIFYESVTDKLIQFLRAFSALISFTSEFGVLEKAATELGLRTWIQPPFPSSRISVYQYHMELFRNSSSNMPSVNSWSFIQSNDQPNHTKTALIHQGSGSVSKNWPAQNFFTVAQFLKRKGFRITWLCGPAELHTQLPPATDDDKKLLSPALSDLADYLSRCTLYIGNDSGVSHLAGLIGCPSIIIFGPSDPQIWAPIGTKKQILYSQNCSAHPCHRITVTTDCRQSCLSSITPELVIDAIERLS